MSGWAWTEMAAVLAVHDRFLAEYGGSDSLRAMGGLESALGRPRNLAPYGDSQAHAFVDGNKRVASATARAFLRLNGHGLTYDKTEAVTIMLRVAEGTVGEDELPIWFRERLRPL